MDGFTNGFTALAAKELCGHSNLAEVIGGSDVPARAVKQSQGVILFNQARVSAWSPFSSWHAKLGLLVAFVGGPRKSCSTAPSMFCHVICAVIVAQALASEL